MRCSLFIVFTTFFINVWSQEKVDMSLDQAISIAQGEAPVALIAQTRFSNNYWRYQSFLANYKPQLTFDASNQLNREIDAITLPDGTDQFINRSQLASQSGIRLFQRIPQTGGFIYGSSRLRRIDLFGDNAGIKSYLSTPLSFGFSQPLFQLNSDKWMRKLEALDFEISRKEYVEERELIAYDAVDYFFTLYIAQLNLEEARRQKIYADSLYEISVGRFEVGRIAETELLQIELRSKNAETEVATQLLALQSANQELRNFLGLKEDVLFNLLPPRVLESYAIDESLALEYAQRYRSITSDFRRRLLEAEMDVADAQKTNGVNVDLSGAFGLSQTAPTLRGAYRNPIDQENVTLRLQVPIADWGKTRAEREIARSNLELTQRRIEQENVDFERRVVLRVQQMELKRLQLELAQRAFEVAQERLSIAKNRYQIGKIGVTDLNIALNENDVARRSYFQTLYQLWTAHYEIRNLTLYDFINARPIADDNRIVLPGN
ncbi:MAG: TolC family protein [Saprospiraceae bacterium]|nr:TolC family protein [Saprospiraceae bacterium]